MSARVTARARLRSILRVVRLRPFEVATEEGRSLERYRRAVLSSASSLVARFATVATALVTVPLTVAYLGDERYGMWLTISTLLAFAYVADLGVTQGLQTAIARASGRDDRDAAIRYVSTAAAVLCATTAVGGLVLVASQLVVPWAALFNVSSPDAVAEAGPAALAFGAGWLVNILLGVVTRVNDGYQDGLVNNLWQTLGSLLSLAGVFFGIRAQAGLPVLMILFVGGPVVANIGNGVLLFARRRPWLRPRLRHVDRALVGELVGTGVWYLTSGLCYVVVQLASTMVVAQLLGSAVVPEFGVPARVAAVGSLFLSLVAAPLWPAYAEALMRGDHAWVRRTMIRSTVFMLGTGAIFAAGFVILGGPLVTWWVSGAVTPSWSMLAGLAAFTVVTGFENALAAFLFASGAVKVHAILWLVGAVLGVPLLIGFVIWFGVDGVPWALFLINLVVRVIPAAIYCRNALNAGATPAR